MENKEKLQEQQEQQTEKKTRKQKWAESKLKSKLMICLLYVAVLSAATYAWFTLNNKPKVYNLALTANGSADLLIADDLGSGPGEYGDELDLQTARQDPYPMDEMLLNPVTTEDVKTFYAPIYDGNAVTDKEEVRDDELNESYVYQKTFYLKATSLKNNQGKTVTRNTRYYDIMLLGPDQGEEYTGCQIKQADGSRTEGGATAANSIRIAFILGDGQSGQDEIKVYEPNSDQHNTGEYADNRLPSSFGGYATMKQPSALGGFENGEDGRSETLFTIQEEVDVKVTMLVWVEGTDVDCTNSIQMDDIVGNIQFVSKETTANASRR